MSTFLSETALSLTGTNRSSKSLTRHQLLLGLDDPFCALNILVYLHLHPECA